MTHEVLQIGAARPPGGANDARDGAGADGATAGAAATATATAATTATTEPHTFWRDATAPMKRSE